MTSESYYYAKWRNQSLRLIMVLGALANAIIGAILAGFYDRPTLAIALCVLAVFLTFLARIKFNDCEEAHTRWLRSIPNPNTTNQ